MHNAIWAEGVGSGSSLTSSLDPGNSRRNALSSVVSCQIRTPPSRYPDWLPEEVLDSIGVSPLGDVRNG